MLGSASSLTDAASTLTQPRNWSIWLFTNRKDSQSSTNDSCGPTALRDFRVTEKLAMIDGHPSTDQPRQAWLNREDWPVQLLLISHELLNIDIEILCLYSSSITCFLIYAQRIIMLYFDDLFFLSHWGTSSVWRIPLTVETWAEECQTSTD